jgi:Ca-activated chloride channel family protein
MRYLKQILILAAITLPAIGSYAQEKKLVREGNKLYEEKRYKEAADAYQQAINKKPGYTPGMFNLGNTMYQQKQYDAARKVLGATAKAEKDKDGKSAANYNIGNTYMQEQKWQEAVDAYKQALRNNPQDADAKYNLSYAQTMLKKQQGGGGKDKNKDKKDDKNKDKDKQDNKDNKDDKKDQDKDKQNKNDKQDDNKDKQDQKPQPQPSKLSEKQAEQLLNALQQEEKKLQDKNQKAKGVPVKIEKDW